MKRRDFLKASAVAGVATVCGTQLAAAQGQASGGNGMPKLTLAGETGRVESLSAVGGRFPAAR